MGTYQPREYCVQYRESSFNFISRLLEEEGIFFYFEHTQSKHTIIFVDKSNAQQACPGHDKLEYAYDKKGWVDKGTPGVGSFRRDEATHVGKFSVTDYNFETPNVSLMSTETGATKDEVYDYPGEFGTKGEGSRYARLRLEELESAQFCGELHESRLAGFGRASCSS